MRKFHNLFFLKGGNARLVRHFGSQIAKDFAGIVVHPIFDILNLFPCHICKACAFREFPPNHAV
jgi:hypothetical protein